MNRKFKLLEISCICISIFFMMQILGCTNNNTVETSSTSPGSVNEEGVKQDLNIDDFKLLKKGMSITEVNEIIGKPQTPIITGRYLPVYTVIDENDNLTVITLEFDSDNCLFSLTSSNKYAI